MTLQTKVPVAFISGATGTIGRAITDRLLRENFAVLMFARDEEKLLVAKRELHEKYPMTILRVISGNVANDRDIYEAVVRMRSYAGPISLLVNAHGAPPAIMDATQMPRGKFRSVQITDVEGTFNTCTQTAEWMIYEKQGGCIVNLSSIHSVATYPGRAAYAAAKSAVVGMSRALALEWAVHGIRVNCISPGQVRGPRTTNANGHTMEQVLQRVPTGKLVEASDIAETVMYLWRTPSITGENIVIDGGHTASAWYMPYRQEVQ